MAVIKAKPEKIVRLALAIMERKLISPYITTRLPDDAFTGAKNDTITVSIGRLRAVARTYEWRTRTAPIVMDDIQGEGGLAFKLDTHTVSATSLTLEQLTLDEIELMRDVVGPQAEAVADQLEAATLTKFGTIPWKRTMAITSTTDPHLAAIEARRLLDADKVAPRAGRVYLIGSNVEAAWLASGRLSEYNSTGQEGTPALRDAIIGRLAGAPVISMMELDPNFIWYGHPSALAVANVAPVIPRGATTGRRAVSSKGYAGTWLMDYDPSYARDRSVFHAFSGMTDVRDERNANGDLLDPTGAGYATAKNVRGIGITFDPGADGGSVLT